MAFLGLRKWPTPVRLPQFFTTQAELTDTHQKKQVAKPLWPFVAASTITFYLVSKMQDAGVKCESPEQPKTRFFGVLLTNWLCFSSSSAAAAAG